MHFSFFSPKFNKVANGEAVSPSSDQSPINGNSNSDEKRPLEHIQTYRYVKITIFGVVLMCTRKNYYRKGWGG